MYTLSSPYHGESRSLWYIYKNDDIIASFSNRWEAEEALLHLNPPSLKRRETLEMRIYNDKWETYALLRSFHIPSSHAIGALS